MLTLLALGGLLTAPTCALHRLSGSIDYRVLAGIPVLASTMTFLAYRSDKRRAELGQWRIPESTLHLLELLGGWPGAFLAQRIFRHKTSKLSYQGVFWGIVILYQFLAFDFMRDWRLIKALWQMLHAR